MAVAKLHKITREQFLAAQAKAYDTWVSILASTEDYMFNSLLYRGCYISLSPRGIPSVVTHEASRINQATGMFRFPDRETAEEFMRLMGTEMYHLFPGGKLKTGDES